MGIYCHRSLFLGVIAVFSDAMLCFLSRDSILAHIDYMKNLRHRYSIIEKSYPALSGKDIFSCKGRGLPRTVRDEAEELMREYLSHKLYFSSFAENLSPCQKIRKFYPSEDSFCYEVLTLARKYNGGFIYIFSAGGSSPRILHSSDIPRVFERDTPTLAFDISEHAYFADYGFERDNYLKSAVARLDINKLFLPKDLT